MVLRIDQVVHMYLMDLDVHNLDEAYGLVCMAFTYSSVF